MNQPFTPDTELLVRFGTRANKRLGDPGSTYLSRQATNLPAGTVLEVVEDDGDGALFARRGADVFMVHRSDLMPNPTPAMVAHNAVQVQILTRNLEEARYQRLETEKLLADTQALAGRLREQRDEALAQLKERNILIRKAKAQLNGLPERD